MFKETYFFIKVGLPSKSNCKKYPDWVNLRILNVYVFITRIALREILILNENIDKVNEKNFYLIII